MRAITSWKCQMNKEHIINSCHEYVKTVKKKWKKTVCCENKLANTQEGPLYFHKKIKIDFKVF